MANPKVKNIFILMLENHSFDNVLGFSGISGLNGLTGNEKNNYTYISTATTTVVSGTVIKRVNLAGIFINKTLTGTVTVKAGATTIGIFAIGTVPNTYWYTKDGIEVADLQIVTSAGDDVTIGWNNL